MRTHQDDAAIFGKLANNRGICWRLRTTFHVKRFWYRRRENASRDGLFLRVCIADAARDVQMAQRISAKVRITVVAVGLSDANVSRETVI
jgi:hypothetical protein